MHKMGNGLPIVNKQSDCLSLITFFCVGCKKGGLHTVSITGKKSMILRENNFFQEAGTSQKNFSSKEDVNCNNKL